VFSGSSLVTSDNWRSLFTLSKKFLSPKKGYRKSFNRNHQLVLRSAYWSDVAWRHIRSVQLMKYDYTVLWATCETKARYTCCTVLNGDRAAMSRWASVSFSAYFTRNVCTHANTVWRLSFSLSLSLSLFRFGRFKLHASLNLIRWRVCTNNATSSFFCRTCIYSMSGTPCQTRSIITHSLF